MRRSIALAVLLASGWATSEGATQERQRRASLFDLGFYGGGAYSSDWFESRTQSSTGGVIAELGEERGHRIGLAPIFGANATFYGLPWFGLRAHYGYMPSDLPEASEGMDDDTEGSDYPVNNHFYDLSLVFRAPAIPLFSSLVGNGYFFLGGGGLTTDVAGGSDVEGDADCVPELLADGACLSREPDYATVGQGVVGLGGDLVSLTSNIGIFAELAAHIYDSPVHVGDGFVPRITVRPGQSFRIADDRIAATGRAVVGLKFAFGGGEEEVVMAPPLPAPLPPAPAPPPPPAERALTVCVVENGQLREVQAFQMVESGDTLVMSAGTRRPFAQVYANTAPNYAAGAAWYTSEAPLEINNQEYVRFGVTRLVTPAQLSPAGNFQGTPIFVETGSTAPHSVVYVPVRTGCEFQPYQLRQKIRARG